MSSRAAYESSGRFSWAKVYEQLDWLPDGGLNIAHEAIDRHARGTRGDDAALVWLGRHGEREEHTFEGLSRLTSRFGNLLRSLGVEKGDRICTSLGRLPELYVALLGTLKAGAVAVPLPAGSGPDAIKRRMLDTKAKVLLTDPETRRSLYTAVFEMFDLQHIIVVNKDGRDPLPPETADLDYDEEMGKAPDSFTTEPTGEYDHATIHYAGGGPGAVQAHLSAAQHFVTGRWAMGLDGGDTVWSLAQPSTPAGLALGVLAPWTLGAKLVVYEDDVDTSGCYAAMARHRVSVLHAPATALENMSASGKGIADDHDLSSLRHVVTDGGVLGADTVGRASAVLGAPVYDCWLQAETGTAVVASSPSLGVRPGSAGRAVHGLEVSVLDAERRPVPPSSDGELAVRPGWPSMFRGYWGDPDAYTARFRRGWYLTGQGATIDADGFVWMADPSRTRATG